MYTCGEVGMRKHAQTKMCAGVNDEDLKYNIHVYMTCIH